MKCPRCGADSGVVNTRQGEHLTVKRQHKCFNGHVFHTTEMHNAAAVSAKQRVKVFAATVSKRITLWKRDRSIARDISQGVSWQHLAAQHNLEKSAVYLAIKKGKK